jgi:hypothetical protein
MIPEAAARLSRRSVVAAAVAAVGTGCSAGGDGSDGSYDAAERQPAPGAASARLPGAAAQAQAVRDSTALLGRYDAAAAAHPSLAPRLRPLRAEVARHVAAFGGTAPSAAHPAAGSPAAPATPAKALAGLAAAERDLADRRAAALLSAPGGLALLLASVAAAGAGHAALLVGGSGKGGDTGEDEGEGEGADEGSAGDAGDGNGG